MSRGTARFGWAVPAMLCLAIMACAGGVSTPAKFYMLTPVAPTTDSRPVAAESATVRVNLEPVEVPRYLNRPQIVSRMDGAEYHLEEFNQWLEPLGDNLTRVVAENLSEMLAADGVDVLIMAPSMQTRFRMAIQILRLDGKRGEKVVLVARWSLFDQTDNEMVLTRRTVIEQKVDDDGYHGFVTAQNRTVDLLSREVADAIRSILLASIDRDGRKE